MNVANLSRYFEALCLCQTTEMQATASCLGIGESRQEPSPGSMRNDQKCPIGSWRKVHLFFQLCEGERCHAKIHHVSEDHDVCFGSLFLVFSINVVVNRPFICHLVTVHTVQFFHVVKLPPNCAVIISKSRDFSSP